MPKEGGALAGGCELDPGTTADRGRGWRLAWGLALHPVPNECRLSCLSSQLASW